MCLVVITDGVGVVNMAWITFFLPALFCSADSRDAMALSLLCIIIIYSVGNSVSPLFL